MSMKEKEIALNYIKNIKNLSSVDESAKKEFERLAQLNDCELARAVINNRFIVRGLTDRHDSEWGTLRNRFEYQALYDLPYKQLIMSLASSQLDYNYLTKFLADKYQTDSEFKTNFDNDDVFPGFFAALDPKLISQFNIKPANHEQFCLAEMLVELGDVVPLTKEQLSPAQLDLVSIRAFLSDKDKVLAQLKKLEGLLVDRLKELKIPTNLTGFNDYVEGKPFKHNKLLSGFFSKWVQENNFLQIIKLKNQILAEEFLKHLQNKEFIKDIGLGDTDQIHGEWTHLLQWWCLIEANKDFRFLTLTPAELYEWLGTMTQNFWDHTFEGSTYHITDKTNFRNVASFFHFLISDNSDNEEVKNTCPHLYQLIKGRVQKRDEHLRSTSRNI